MYTYFISDLYKFIENERSEGGTLLSYTNDIVDPYDDHVVNCVESAFKTMECNQIHNFTPMKKMMTRNINGKLKKN